MRRARILGHFHDQHRTVNALQTHGRRSANAATLSPQLTQQSALLLPNFFENFHFEISTVAALAICCALFAAQLLGVLNFHVFADFFFLFAIQKVVLAIVA